MRRVFLYLAAAALAGAETKPCSILPADNVWNTPVDTLPLDANSAAYVSTIGSGLPLHADFGAGLYQGAPIGIPSVEAAADQPRVPVRFVYEDESDAGPYPIPPDAPIEGGAASKGDRHILVLDRGACVLYELFSAYPEPEGGWRAGSGAIFDLQSNALRPREWTSADAAGLPIYPGLVRDSEMPAGEIKHAIRFTAPRTRRAFVWPARHFASRLTGIEYPPMGQRFRLRADFDVTGFPPQAQIILRALQKYGMILADNGSSWFISGEPGDGWMNEQLQTLRRVHGADFEAVDSSSLMADPDSGRVAAPPSNQARVPSYRD